MSTTRRVGRWVAIAVGGVLALLVLGWVGLGIYLNTAAGKAFVARQISARIGMPVEVTSVGLGLRSSSIGLKVFDPEAPNPAQAEVLGVESANADVSLFALARGDIAPSTVELRNVNLQLHVGADGKMLTTMPKMPEGGGGAALPAIKLNGGQVTVRQDGRPEFALKNVNVQVEPAGDDVKFSGTIDDPQWSKWTIGGDINKATKTGAVEFATDDGPLTMDRLGSLPFVPDDVWKHIRPNGRGAIDLKLTLGSDRDVHYLVDVRPKGASLTLPDADVTLSNVTGLARVAGKKVELQGAKAEVAGGTFSLDGNADFGQEPTAATIKVAASGLDVRSLPATWDLPRDIAGQLQGTANLKLKIHSDGHIETAGGGTGEITDAKIRDIPVTFKLELRSDGKRFRFDQPARTGMRRRPTPPTPLPAGRGELSGSPSLQGGGRGVGSARPCAQPPKQPDPKAAPTTLDASITMRDIEIGELLQKLNVKIGYKISGKVTAQLSLAVPLESAASKSAYEFTGKVSSPALTLEGLTIHDLSAHATYKNGLLTLKELKGTILQPGDPKAPPGTFHGSASAAVEPAGDVTAALALDRIPLGEVLKAVPNWTVEVKGLASGKVDLKGPYDKLSDTTAWSGSAEVTSPELVIAGRSAKSAKLAVSVAKGTATLKELSATVEGIPVTATATLSLTGKYPFTASVKTSSTDVTDLRKLVPEFQLPAPVEGVLETDTRAMGTISPLAFTATGTVHASKLTLAKTPANNVGFQWELTPDRFVLKELKADLFSGSLAGNADVPLAADKGGSFNLTFKNFDIAAATPLIPNFPVRVSGQVSGHIKGTIDPAKPGLSRAGKLDVELTAPKLTVQGIPAERLVGKAAIKEGVLDYSLEGKTLGGSFELKGRYPGQKKDAGGAPPQPVGHGWGGGEFVRSDPLQRVGAENSLQQVVAKNSLKRVTTNTARNQNRSSFRLTGADLSRVAPELGFQSLAPLRGRVDVTFDFADDLSSGSGRIALTNLAWGDTRITRELSAVILLRDGILQVADANGTLAGGSFRGRAQVRLNERERNYFTLTVEGASAKRLFAIVPQVAQKVDGSVSITLHGRFGREMRGSGTLTMARGTVSGVTVGGLRIPFRWNTSPGGYSQIAIREAKVDAGTGTVQADLTATLGVETQVDGQVKLVNVPIRTIAPNVGDFALIGNGRITGRFDLTGSNVRSVDDLSGTLVARFGHTSPREIPILQQAVPFLNTSGLVKPFDSGDVRGTLSRGVFRVQRLALVSPKAQLFAEGNITTAGRLDLRVIGHTGTIGPESAAFGLLGLRLPAFGPIPLTLLQDVNSALSNRTVRLSITGSVRDPQVKVNVGALISEEVARFFLSKFIPADVAAAAGLSSGIGVLSGSKK